MRVTNGTTDGDRVGARDSGRARPLASAAPLRWAMGPAAGVFAAGVQYLLLPEPAIAPFVFCYFSVALAAWLAGRLAGVLAVVTCAITANYLFIEPYRAWALSGPALTATSLFLVSSGAVALLCSAFRDAHLRAGRARDDLLASEARLREADRRKDEFLAMLSHELRNPLAPVSTSLYLLARAEPGGAQAGRAIQVIERQVAHMVRLVDDLLDVSRITRGKIQLQRERLELGALARRTVEDHRALFERRGIELVFDGAADALWLEGDPTRLAQVLGNLLHNASKFTPAGGRATVSVDRGEAGEARLRVSDTGAGVPAEMLGRLFEPFLQVDPTLDRGKGGLGLGLALVRGLVALHGGRVDAASEGRGRGAEFVVRLPLAPPGVAAAPAAIDARADRAAGRRVLVIEDNVDAANSLGEALSLAAHTVEIAYSGPAGLEEARAFRPEVVICDIGLPGLDGYGVARALRADPALGSVYLIALTGYAGAEDVERARRAGFDRHLPKPADLAALEDALAAAPRARVEGAGVRR